MCNAFNHAPGCNCGWGGVWYGGARDNATWLFNRPLHHPRKLGRQTGTFQQASRGYSQPNAACPVCGQRVFFHASPFGGRVFFDELGPPWPKHPCTDHSSTVADAVVRPRTPQGSLSWLGDVHLAKVGPTTYEVQGISNGKKYLFYFDAAETVMAEIVRFRPLQHGNIELHILDYNDERRCWVSWQGQARVKQLSSTPASKLKSSIVHQHMLETLRDQRAGEARHRQAMVANHRLPGATAEEHQSLVQKKICVTPDGLYQCPKCPARLGRKRVLRHLLEAHKTSFSQLPLLPSLPTAELVELVPCPECSAKVSMKNLAKHRLHKHGIEAHPAAKASV